MTDATSLTLTVDGTSLSSYAWNVRNRAGRWHVPGVTGGNVDAAGRHGKIYRPNKMFEENVLTLSMWALGTDGDGLIPSNPGAVEQCRLNLDTLSRIFGKRYGLIDVRQKTGQTGATERQCFAEVVQAIDFTSMAGSSRAEFAVELLVPGSFWQDSSDQTFTSAAGIAAGSTQTAAAFSAATAPMEDLIYTVHGAGTNVRLTDVLTGFWVQYNAPLINTDSLVFNASDWTVKKNGVSVIANVTRSGQGRLLVLSPNASGPQIVVGGSGFDGASQLTVVGRRKYLLS